MKDEISAAHAPCRLDDRLPARHPIGASTELLDAVGFDHGMVHVEVIINARGVWPVEINPRLVGARLARLLGTALGRSLHDLIKLHLGPLDEVPTQAQCVAAIRRLTTPRAGQLRRLQLPPAHAPGACAVEMRIEALAQAISSSPERFQSSAS